LSLLHASAHSIGRIFELLPLDDDPLDPGELKALLPKVLNVTALVRKTALPQKLKQRIPYLRRLELARCNGQIEPR
jgi:hypothetical protein